MATDKRTVVDESQDPGLSTQTDASVSVPPSTETKTLVINYTDPPLYGVPQLQIFNDPGGSGGQIQFNTGQGFGGSPNLVWNGKTSTVGVRGNLTVTGNIAGKITTNPTNFKLYGGINGHILSTDGLGNLSWISQSGGGNATPAGVNTQVQFNDASAFGGNSGLTFNKTAGALAVTKVDTADIYHLNGVAVENSDLTHGATASLILPANGNTTVPVQVNNTYGNVQLTTGINPSSLKTWTFGTDGSVKFPNQATNNRTGNADALVFTKSTSQKSISTQPGDEINSTVERLVIAGGDSYYDENAQEWFGEGGDVYLWAGQGGNGGDVKVDAGQALGLNGDEGGTVKIRGGYSQTGSGGFVNIEAGYGAGTNGGEVNINAGGGTFVGGDITLTAGNGGTASGKVAIVTQRGQLNFGEDLEVPGLPEHFHISKNSNFDLFLGDDSNYVKLPILSGIELQASEDGVGVAKWTLDALGGITFPDSTVQTTAWQGVPASETAPTTGLIWFNSIEARMYVKYNNQWVDASPTVLPEPDNTPTFESVTFNDASVQTTAWKGVVSYNNVTDKPTFVGGGGASTWLTAN